MKIKVIGKLLFIFCLTLQTAGSAQGLAEFKGTVKDKLTGEPLTDVILDINYGGFSNAVNEDGDFVFRIPNLVLDSVEIRASAVGYKSVSYPARSLTSDSNTFFLEKAEPVQTTLGISDATVTVQLAIDSMRANNYLTAMLQNGFYLEYVALENQGIVKLKEATLRVERFPSDTKRPDRFKDLENRQIDWSRQSGKVDAWFFENGPAVLIRALETGLPEFLTRDEMKKYEFRVDSMLVPYDTLALYKIHFEPKSAALKGGRTGYIYIEPQSRAIVRLEYNFTDKAIKELLSIGISNVKLSSDHIRFVSQYRRSGEKWVLAENRMTADILYEERLDRKFTTKAHWNFRFVATESVALKRGGVGELDQLMTTSNFRKSLTLSPEIWKSQNYLPPTRAMLLLPSKLRK